MVSQNGNRNSPHGEDVKALFWRATVRMLPCKGGLLALALFSYMVDSLNGTVN